MKIIIVGAGRTGIALIEALLQRSYNDITIVERDKHLLNRITDTYNVNGIVGSGASRESLYNAGADTADVLIALTPVDEINILCCMQAKSIGTQYTVARVFQPGFSAERKLLKEEERVDYIFNPNYDLAEIVYNSIGYPGIVRPEGIFADGMQAVSISIGPDSPLKGYAMSEVRGVLGFDIIIGSVIRDGKLHIPTGRFTIEEGDSIGITINRDNIMELLKKMGVEKNPAKRILIVGGGITTEYLLEMLSKDKKNITVIDSDLERCRELMEHFPHVTVTYSQNDKEEVLEKEKIADCDVVISLTNSDEENLVTGLYAWSRNVPSVLTRIEKPGQLALLHKINLDITLSPAEISVNRLIRFIHSCDAGMSTDDIKKYCTIANNKADVFQFVVSDSFSKLDVPIKDSSFRLKKNVLLTAIVREGRLIVPDRNTSLKSGDKVFVVSDRKNHIEKLNDIFLLSR